MHKRRRGRSSQDSPQRLEKVEVFPSRTRQDAGWRIVEGQALLESGLGMVNVPQPSASEDQNEQEEV